MKAVTNVEAAGSDVRMKISTGSIPKAVMESFSGWGNVALMYIRCGGVEIALTFFYAPKLLVLFKVPLAVIGIDVECSNFVYTQLIFVNLIGIFAKTASIFVKVVSRKKLGGQKEEIGEYFYYYVSIFFVHCFTYVFKKRGKSL